MAADHASQLELDTMIDEDLLDYDFEKEDGAAADPHHTSDNAAQPEVSPSIVFLEKETESSGVATLHLDSIDFGLVTHATESDLWEADDGRANLGPPRDDENGQPETTNLITESFEEDEISWEEGNDHDIGQEGSITESQNDGVQSPTNDRSTSKQPYHEEGGQESEEIDNGAENENAGPYETVMDLTDENATLIEGDELTDAAPMTSVDGPLDPSQETNDDSTTRRDTPNDLRNEGYGSFTEISEQVEEYLEYDHLPGDETNEHVEDVHDPSQFQNDDDETSVATPQALSADADANASEPEYSVYETYGEEAGQSNDTSGNISRHDAAEDLDPQAESHEVSPYMSPEMDIDIPDITVMYKNVDYPLFYGSPGSEGKECFFDDLGLLSCKMEELLANFHRELADEISPLEELVLQFDELGLEFAESTSQSLFSEITLTGMVELFDQLLKNQDPDETKSLHAYLITRPNCKKRWESLIDDAYTGKGLDEVCYYFHHPRRNDDLDEILDPITHDQGTPDESASPGDSELEETEYLPNDFEHQAAPEDGEGEDGEGFDPDIDEPLHDVEDPEYVEMNADGALGEGPPEATANSPDEPVDTSMLEANVTDDLTNEVFDGEGKSLADQYNAPKPDDTSPTSPQQEGHEVDQHGDEQADTTNDSAPLAGQQCTNDGEATGKVTPETSATSTLNGDPEITFDADVELSPDSALNAEEDAGVLVQENELDEIDWREFPGDEEDEEPKVSLSVAGKRPRPDEDDVTEITDEKDVKRRRS